MKKKLKLGFVGAGFMGQYCHLQSFSEINDCEIIAIADKRKDLANKVAKKYKIKNIYYSHKDLIKSNLDLNGVVIITRRTMTGPIALDFLKSGYNVFTEKPMCCSSTQAKKLLKVQKEKKLIFTVGYNKRYDYGVVQAKKQIQKIIKKKTLGNIIFVRSHRYSGTGYLGAKEKFKSLEKYPKGSEWSSAPSWINSQKERYSFHGYLNTFSHNINLIRYFFNEVPKVEFADMKRDFANLVVLSFKNFNCSVETKNYKDEEWDENITIYFENGFLKLYTPPQMKMNSSAYFYLYNRKTKKKKIYRFNSKWSFHYQSKEFINNLKLKKNGISSSFDHIKDISLIENIWKRWLKE